MLPFPLGEYEFRYNGTEGLAVVGLSTPSTSRDSSSKQKTLIGGDADTIMLLLKNLAATTSAVVARLDRLEGAHFDARGPADLGAIGSTTIETPESIIN